MKIRKLAVRIYKKNCHSTLQQNLGKNMIIILKSNLCEKFMNF